MIVLLNFESSFYHVTSPLDLATIACPVEPAARVFTNVSPASLPRETRRRAAANPSLAVEDDLLVLGRPRPSEAVLELLLGDVEAVGRGAHGDVDRAWYVARGLELAGLSHVCSRHGRHVSIGSERWEKMVKLERGRIVSCVPTITILDLGCCVSF